MSPTLVTASAVKGLLASGKERARLNVHKSYEDKVQRMVVTMKPGEEKPPHANKRELTQIIRAGDADLLIYDDSGNLIDSFRISPDHVWMYVLPAGMWHTKAVRETLEFVEIMEGPYEGKRDVALLEKAA